MLALLGLAAVIWFGVHTLYVVAMAAKAAYDAKKLTRYWMVMLAPAAVLGVALDVVFQLTFGWVMFLETPTRGGWLFSNRVEHHFRYKRRLAAKARHVLGQESQRLRLNAHHVAEGLARRRV